VEPHINIFRTKLKPETHATQRTHRNARSATQRTQRNVAIAMRANAHKLSPPQSHFHKNTHIQSAIHGRTGAFCCFCNLLPRTRCHLNMFEFLQFYIKQTRVFLNSIYQIDIPPRCTRRHCRKQTYEWQHVIGRLSVDDCYWSLLAFRCVENRIDPILAYRHFLALRIVLRCVA